MVSRLPDNVVVSNGKDGLKKGTTVGFFGIPNLKDIAGGREASQRLSPAELQHFAMDAIKDAGAHTRLSKIMGTQFVPVTIMPTPRPTPPTPRPTPRPSPTPTPQSGAPTVTIAPRTHMPKGISAARAKKICTHRKGIQWGAWGACSTSCGKRVGVQYRAMLPLSAGKLPTWCPYHEVRTCNSDIPCSSMPSLRPPAPTPPTAAPSATPAEARTPTESDGELGAPAGDGDPTQCRNPGRCVGVGKTSYCAGHQQAGFGAWKLLHTRAGSNEVDGVPLLMTYVDTRACGFENTPAYLHSLAVDDTSGDKGAALDGSDGQGPGQEPGWDLLMTTAIHTANTTGFHVFAVPSFAFRRVGDAPTYNAQQVLQRARQRWGIAWVGVTGSEAGATRIGMTGWRATATKDVLYADVNTTAAQFKGPHAPRYFVSMHRASTTLPDSCGTHSVFSATPNGFRVYMFQPPGRALTARQAEQQRWTIMWFGVGQRVQSSAGEDAGVMLGHGALSLHNAGVSSPKAWEQHSPGENPRFIQTRVDASDRQFLHPIFITSLDRGSDHYPFMTAGAACTFFRVKKGESEQDADASDAMGFEMYVDTANAPPHFTSGYSSQFGWRVNFLGIEINRDCVMGAWGDWTTTCSKTCGTGRFVRRRAAIVSAIGAGKACPALSQSRPCNTQACITASPTPAPTPKRVDCVMTQWGDWRKCSRSCGGGHRGRNRRVTVFAQGGGQPCGEVKQTESCDTHLCHPHTPGQRIVTCGGGGSGASHVQRSGIGGAAHTTGATKWRSFGADGIYTDVDTTLCLFEDEPQYVTAVIGDAAHWALQGTNTVASQSRDRFRVIVIHPYLRSMALLGAARIFKWRLSWVAMAGRATGATKAGETGWRAAADVQTLGPGLYTEVSTRAAGFQAGIWNDGIDSPVMPRYFTALRGLRGHWRLTGSHVLFYPSMMSFRVYVQYQHRAISAKEAESKGWVISWFGDVNAAASGSSRAKWELMGALDAPSARGGTLGCHTRVDLRDHHFTAARPPSYVASITAVAASQGDYAPPTLVHQQLWNVSGGTAMFSSDVSGFSVLLNFDMRDPPPHFSGCSSRDSWRVNWFAYLPHRDCVMTPWAAWGACACTGMERGIERRFRTIAQFPSGGGTPCSKQHAQSRHCDIFRIRCPTPAPTPVRPTPPPTPSPTPLPPLGLSTTHVVRLTGKLQLRLCATCRFAEAAQQTFRSVLAGMLGISISDVQVHPTDYLPTDDGLAVVMSYKIDLSDKISAFEARANMHTTTFVGAFGHRLKVLLHAKGDGYNTATLVSPMHVADATIQRITHAPTPKPKPVLQTQQQESAMAPTSAILGPTKHAASGVGHGHGPVWWSGIAFVLAGTTCVVTRTLRSDAEYDTSSGNVPTAGAIALQVSQKDEDAGELTAGTMTDLGHAAGSGEYGYGAVDPDDGFTAALPQSTGNDISIAFVGDADTEV